MLKGQPVLLLTGATGLVGRQLLGCLLESRPDRSVLALARNRGGHPPLSQDKRILVLDGDVTQPDLGLGRSTLTELQNCLTEIIHCAAEIRFDRSLDQARATNTFGTLNVLNAARRCRRLQKFAYLSTVYIAGRCTGHFAELPICHQKGFVNTYQQSKYEAEELVTAAKDDIPAVIFRLSTLIGDSSTGHVRQFNYFHQLLKLFPRNMLPIAPCEIGAPFDLIPTDWAIPALSYLFESAFSPGRIYHVCVGPEASLTAQELINLTLELFETHPKSQRWAPFQLPEFVKLSIYEEYVQKCGRDGSRLLNELLRVLGYFLPHFGMFQAFENTQTINALSRSNIKPPKIRDYYSKIVGYCLETDWGRKGFGAATHGGLK